MQRDIIVVAVRSRIYESFCPRTLVAAMTGKGIGQGEPDKLGDRVSRDAMLAIDTSTAQCNRRHAALDVVDGRKATKIIKNPLEPY